MREDAVARALAYLDTMPAQGTTSMQRDIVDGRPSELDSLGGAVTRFGIKTGVRTPTNTFLYHVLLPHEQRARGLLVAAGWV